MTKKLKAWRISGSVPCVFNAQVIANIGEALNHNADVLDELIEHVKKLEKISGGNKVTEYGNLNIKIKKLTDTAQAPERANDFAAGADLRADIPEDVIIRPGETLMISTGLAIEIPKGYFGAVYPRSGLSTKQGLRLANCVGVIDSDYRGAIGVPLHNDSPIDQVVHKGERVAQLVIQPYLECSFREGNLSETERGQNGFGSSGRL